jgi:hypothetical protein
MTKKLRGIVDDLWDRHSESIGTDFDSLQEFVGTVVLTRESLDALVDDLVKKLKRK